MLVLDQAGLWSSFCSTPFSFLVASLCSYFLCASFLNPNLLGHTAYLGTSSASVPAQTGLFVCASLCFTNWPPLLGTSLLTDSQGILYCDSLNKSKSALLKLRVLILLLPLPAFSCVLNSVTSCSQRCKFLLYLPLVFPCFYNANSGWLLCHL